MGIEDFDRKSVSRRQLLAWIAGGVGALVVAGVAGFELVEHDVLPGKYVLDQLDGACSLAVPVLSFGSLGPTSSGRFYSKARKRSVGYTIAYPPHARLGEELPLIVMLHGYGGDHNHALFAMTPAQAVALKVDGKDLPPAAIVTVDGGNGYWNPHPGDDPMSMVVDELIPMCQRRGLGRLPKKIAMMGISMGAYGALAICERNPGLIAAVAAISPAIWTSYAQANAANAGAFPSAAAFTAGDVIAHVAALEGIPVRIASGLDDPFLSGVREFIKVLPEGETVVVARGCHTEAFFLEQEPPSLDFLTRHLA